MQEWPSFGFWKDVVLCALAFYAAVLSTYNWRQSIRKEKRVINVETYTKLHANVVGTLGRTFLEIRATNIGQRPVTVRNLGIQTPMKTIIWSTKGSTGSVAVADTTLPATLSDGQSAQLHYSYRDIGHSLINNGFISKSVLRPVCFDSVGGVHLGLAFEVNPAEWSNM